MSYSKNSLLTANYTQAKVWKYTQDILDNAGQYDFRDITNFNYFDISNSQNRPLKVVSNLSTNNVLIGTEPEYGLYGGSLTSINLNTNEHYIFRNIVEGHLYFKFLLIDQILIYHIWVHLLQVVLVLTY